MKEQLSQHVVTVAGSPKTAAAVSTVATAAGLGTVLNLIPGVMGFVVMCVGISVQLIFRRKGILESEKLELEISILKRKEAGLPTRREAEQLDTT